MNEARLFQAALRTDMAVFAQRAFRDLNPARKLVWSWHLDAICHALEKVRTGETKRLVINVPPRSLKSTLGSVIFPAFVLGQDPTARIVCVSYSADLAKDFARSCRTLMRFQWYRNLFPDTEISQDQEAALDFKTTRRGHRIATSVHGTLTGRGGDIVIVDDLMKPDDAHSPARRASTLQWFDNTIYTRLDDQRSGAIVIIMQRLHVDDLTAHVLKNGGWEVLRLPAIADGMEEIPISDRRKHRRLPGEPLDPVLAPLDLLNRLRTEISSAAFAAQYQQDPVPQDGAVFRTSWFRYYEDQELPFDGDEFESWDIGMTATTTSDYSVGTRWIFHGNKYYLTDVVRRRMLYPDLKRLIVEHQRRSPMPLLIEYAGSGIPLIQDLEGEHVNAIPIRPAKDKVVRAMQATSVFEAGRVLLPKSERFTSDFRDELLAFPNASHDDQVDSAIQAINWREDKNRGPIILTGRY
jgi:predicted phage terminase large subunit-like protein